MTAEYRKNSLLPSGWTIAKSWAALRKCWLGFYITKDQGDRDGMVEYAKRIRKIQAELGIEPTNFDPDILDENTVNRIDALYRKSPPPFTETFGEDELSAEEATHIDYSQLMSLSASTVRIPAPRQEIFRGIRKSCSSPAIQPNALVDVEVRDYENSCYKGPPKQQYKNEIRVKKKKTIYEKQCQVRPAKQWENNFAVSAAENTLAVPDPNQPPVEPIFRKESCIYPPVKGPPVKGPPQLIKRDKSREYDSQVNEMQSNKKEKVLGRRAKSCPYTGQIS